MKPAHVNQVDARILLEELSRRVHGNPRKLEAAPQSRAHLQAPVQGREPT